MDSTFKITEGPSFDRLLDAFRYLCDGDADVAVRFDVSYTAPAPGTASLIRPTRNYAVESLAHINDSEHNLILTGTCESAQSLKDRYEPYYFEAYYNSRTRKGRIRFSRLEDFGPYENEEDDDGVPDDDEADDYNYNN